MRTRVRLATLPGNIPSVPVFDGEDKLDAGQEGASFVAKLAAAVSGQDWQAFGDLFADDCWWKDCLTLTFDKRTIRGREAIAKAWKELSPKRKPSGFTAEVEDALAMKAMFVRMAPTLATLDVPFSFTTDSAPRTQCIGIAKMVPVDGVWKIWILQTLVRSLTEHPFADLPRQPSSSAVIGDSQRGNPKAQGLPRLQGDGVLDAIVVGGSCNGIANGIMLDSAGANVAVFDTEAVAGGNWLTKRYDSVTLHHPNFMIQLPNYPVPADQGYPPYLQGRDISRYYSSAVEHLKLPYFAGIKVLSNTWDEATKLWTVTVQEVQSGEKATLKAKNVIISTGFLVSEPLVPELSGRESFKGPVQHSSEYLSPKEYKGLDVLVVGAGNSAHDIAGDLALNGAKSVTILQRGPATLVEFDNINKFMTMRYQGQMPVDTADVHQDSMPTGVMRIMGAGMLAGVIAGQPELNAALEAKGYVLDKTPDLFSRAFEERGRSFYVDHLHVLDLVLADKIKVQRGDARGLVEDGVVVRDLESGEDRVIKANGVVLATGYKNFNIPKTWVESGFMDAKAASKLEDVGTMGVDGEGELPGQTTFSGHPNLYFAGFTMFNCRMIGRCTAIQVMANITGQFPERYARAA